MKWVVLIVILALLIGALYWLTGKMIDAIADAIFDASGTRKKKSPESGRAVE